MRAPLPTCNESQSAVTWRAHGAGSRIALQKKLTIGAVKDPLEHEADRVADRVMRMPDPAPVSTSSASADTLQRKCSCGGSGGGTCDECQNKKLQRSATTSAATGFAPPMVHDVLRSSGQPLDFATRSFLSRGSVTTLALSGFTPVPVPPSPRAP